jgi:hypothetical protein
MSDSGDDGSNQFDNDVANLNSKSIDITDQNELDYEEDEENQQHLLQKVTWRSFIKLLQKKETILASLFSDYSKRNQTNRTKANFETET